MAATSPPATACGQCRSDHDMGRRGVSRDEHAGRFWSRQKQSLAENQNYSYNRSKLAKRERPCPMNRNRASERARKRAVGKILREGLIKRQEAYFDLLVSGYSIEQIASHTKKSPSAVRRAVGQALAKRRLDAPEDYARLQVARLTKALRCADVSLEKGDLKAIAPFVKVVRELNLYHGVNVGRRDRRAGGAAGNRAGIAAACAHTFAWRGGRGIVRRRKKLRKSAVKPLKSFARVNLCGESVIVPFAGPWRSRMHRWRLRDQPCDIDRHAGDERRRQRRPCK